MTIMTNDISLLNIITQYELDEAKKAVTEEAANLTQNPGPRITAGEPDCLLGNSTHLVDLLKNYDQVLLVAKQYTKVTVSN